MLKIKFEKWPSFALQKENVTIRDFPFTVRSRILISTAFEIYSHKYNTTESITRVNNLLHKLNGIYFKMYCIPYYVYHAAVFHMKTNLTNRTISSSSSYNIPTDTTSNSSSMRTVYLQFTFYLSSKLHCRLHIFPRGINYRVVLHIASGMCFHSTVLS